MKKEVNKPMAQRLFGTDGVRGIANQDLGPDLAMRLAYSAVRTLFPTNERRAQVIIGHDTRLSCQMLEAALVAGFTAAGADVYLVGVVPTPGVAFLVQRHRCDLGVVISASHNSYEYNGIKIFDRHGFKLPDEVEDQIEANLDLFSDPTDRPQGDKLGKVEVLTEGALEYRLHLEEQAGLDLSGLRLALDLANGAATAVAPQLFQDLGAEVRLLADQPDGTNINKDCGSTHVEHLAEFVRSEGLDLGLAFDGDADRLMAVDDQGQILDGDVMLAILAKDMHEQGLLDEDTLVVTVMSNIGLDIMAEEAGISLQKTKVGDRYVLDEMRRGGYKLGGEQSGHLIFLDDSSTGDGILSALKLLAVVQRKGQKLSQLRKVISIYPQVLVNVRVQDSSKPAVMADPEVAEACRRLEESLEQQGRVLLRPSGTEPYIRIMLEGRDELEIQALAEELAQFIQEKYGN
jgi:phosphoglucosamine mutase